jgi:hypothetical protein
MTEDRTVLAIRRPAYQGVTDQLGNGTQSVCVAIGWNRISW